MKRLIPSLREKKRYIAFEIDSEHGLDRSNVINAVDISCRNFLGEYGYGKAGVMIVNDAFNDKKGVVRVNSKYVDLVKVSLMTIKEINNNKVALRNVRTSGMLGKVNQNGRKKGG